MVEVQERLLCWGSGCHDLSGGMDEGQVEAVADTDDELTHLHGIPKVDYVIVGQHL